MCSKSMAAGFAQAPNPLTGAQRESIVDFETGLFTAQMHDSEAKSLIADGANGGPTNFSSQDFYIGINDLFGDSVAQEPFDRWFLIFTTPGRVAWWRYQQCTGFRGTR